jgi:cell division protein DivIC
VEDMEKKRVRKSTKHRLFILIPVTLVVITYTIASFSYYVYKIYSLKKEQETLLHQLDVLKDEEDNLQTDIEKFQNPDYLARYARENYHYSKDGELVIQTKKEEQKELSHPEEEEKPSYLLVMICSVFLFIIVVYLFIHKTKKDKVS